MDDDRRRRSRTATCGSGRTPPSSVVEDAFDDLESGALCLTAIFLGTVPKKDVGINDGADGKIVIQFDMPWLIFNPAGTLKRGRNGMNKRSFVSQKKITVDLSPIEDEEAETDTDEDAD